MIASRSRRQGRSTPNWGRPEPRGSARSGSPPATRPLTRNSVTPSTPPTLGSPATGRDPSTARAPTPVDTVAERCLQTFAALDPCAATEFGITGHDDDITDYSPDGVAARAAAAKSTLRELEAVTPVDAVATVPNAP